MVRARVRRPKRCLGYARLEKSRRPNLFVHVYWHYYFIIIIIVTTIRDHTRVRVRKIGTVYGTVAKGRQSGVETRKKGGPLTSYSSRLENNTSLKINSIGWRERSVRGYRRTT